MATYVLVHGAWHGAWCWQKLTPLLEEAGHRVLTVDLPGHGDNPAAVSEMTLEQNAQRIRETIEEVDEPVILVGHSMGGMSVTQAAELVPEKISTLVYLTAFLPNDGQSLPQLAAGDPDELVQKNMIVDEATGTALVADHALRDAFYGECSDEDFALATSLLVPESLAAMGAPVAISEERAGSVPRVYVECLRDRAITIRKQREMHSARGVGRVLQIDTDHSPMLSTPRELADHLLSLV
jgi:pimeloyl-ACP methyl ester carboxylesterase